MISIEISPTCYMLSESVYNIFLFIRFWEVFLYYSKQVLTVAYSMSKFSQRDPWLVYLNNIFIYLFGCVQSQLQHRGSSSLTGKETQVPLHWEYGVSATGLPGKSPG